MNNHQKLAHDLENNFQNNLSTLTTTSSTNTSPTRNNSEPYSIVDVIKNANRIFLNPDSDIEPI